MRKYLYRLENKREAKHRKSKQGGFESSMVFMDFGLAEGSEETPAWLSDGGAGARAVYAHADRYAIASERARRLKTARERLRRHNPDLLDVFNLIVKNGSNRKESIWWLMSKRPINGTPQESSTGNT